MNLSWLTQSYWRDEAFSVLLAGRPLREIFRLVVEYDHTPPLYYYLQHGWISWLGDGEVTMRSLSAGFYLLTVYWVYRLTRSRLAGLALALNPFLWQYAAEARHYTFYLAAVVGAVYYYENKKPFWSNLWWTIAFWTHNFSWLYYGVFWLIKRDMRLLIAPLAGALWLPFAWRQIQSLDREMWLSAPAGFWWWAESFKVFFPAGTALAALLSILAGLKPKKILFLAVVPPLLAYLISKLWTPVYLERYLLPSLAFGLIFIGRSRLKSLLLILVLINAGAFIRLNRQPTKPPMRYAVDQIVDKLQPGDIIITREPINYPEVYYYLKRRGHQDRLYSYLYPGEDHIPDYIGVELIKPEAEILAVPAHRSYWLIWPDASVVRYD